MGAAALVDSAQESPAKAAESKLAKMVTAIHAEAGLSAAPANPADDDQQDEPDVAEEDTIEAEEPQPSDSAPAPEAQAAAAPTAEERLEAEREKDRKRFEARRAGRMYFVRYPRAPDDSGSGGACTRSPAHPHQPPWMLISALCKAGELPTKGLETELETYQVQMRVLGESLNLKKVPTLSLVY